MAVPVLPTTWTPAAIGTFIGALALFVLGTLTQAGVTVPAHLSTEVQVIVGSLGQLIAVVTALVSHLSNHSVAKAQMFSSRPT